MGNHIKNLDEMAHDRVREEAKQRREKKKEKSKSARMAVKKGTDIPGQQKLVEVDEDEGLEDDDVTSENDDLGDALLPTADCIKSKMLLVVASL